MLFIYVPVSVPQPNTQDIHCVHEFASALYPEFEYDEYDTMQYSTNISTTSTLLLIDKKNVGQQKGKP